MATCAWKFKLSLSFLLRMFEGHLLRSPQSIFRAEGALKMSVEKLVRVFCTHEEARSAGLRAWLITIAPLILCCQSCIFATHFLNLRHLKIDFDDTKMRVTAVNHFYTIHLVERDSQ